MTPVTDSKTPNGTITAMKTAQVVATRNITKPRWDRTTSGTPSGVAVIPK